MTFRAAVEATPEIAKAWKSGLQALRRRDRGRVETKDSRRLTGSVSLDGTLKDTHPNDPRWDYGVGYRSIYSDGETVYWIEIHPANSGEVNTVLDKLGWLKSWLAEKAPYLEKMRKEFIWVSSGRTSFTPSSPQAKRFALLGLRHIGRKLLIT